MPPTRDDQARRSVVPQAAGRSLWRAAVWTGVGAAVGCATLAVVAVAIVWLPVSGTTGRTHSAIHAGLLTFLAAVHGGVTVDGTSATFLPLGMLLVVALAAWRAGLGLADAAAAIGETDPARLAVAAGAQAASFAGTCLVAVPFATLGTSSAPLLGVGFGALVLFAVAGGAGLACYSPLSDWCLDRLPAAVRRGARGAAVLVAVYLGAGALLVAASIAIHHGRVEELSRHVGGGWGGVPILLLGVLAVPNAVVAGAAYLAGPGFALGAQTHVGPFHAVHGTLPDFPVLGAVPSGPGADTATWALIALVPVLAGLLLARTLLREDGWPARIRAGGCALALAAPVLFVLAWQTGGSIGAGGLRALGPAPWQLALAPLAPVAAVVTVVLAVTALRGRLSRASAGRAVAALTRQRLSVLAEPAGADDETTGETTREDTGEADAPGGARGADADPGEAANGDQLAG